MRQFDKWINTVINAVLIGWICFGEWFLTYMDIDRFTNFCFLHWFRIICFALILLYFVQICKVVITLPSTNVQHIALIDKNGEVLFVIEVSANLFSNKRKVFYRESEKLEKYRFSCDFRYNLTKFGAKWQGCCLISREVIFWEDLGILK